MADAADDAGRGFIDVNAVFGPAHGTAGTAGAPLDTLVAERRSHGIRLSLASSLLATWADGPTGNRLAAEAAADPANGLAAIAVVGPRRTGARRAARRGGRAVGGRRLPARWLGRRRRRRRRPSARSCGPWPRPGGRCSCRSCRFGAASAIGAATDGLGIPVVLLGAHYTHIVDDLAAAVRYPHLHLETSALAHFRAIETAVADDRRRAGAVRDGESASGRPHRRSARSSPRRSRTTPSARSSAATPSACSAWRTDRST